MESRLERIKRGFPLAAKIVTPIFLSLMALDHFAAKAEDTRRYAEQRKRRAKRDRDEAAYFRKNPKARRPFT